ncbi:MAG TPA: hypothetical protein VGG39_04355 [Polyangiaceae bacterium]|jgi:hypothetical protein
MNRTELPIASPCSADWTTMTLADRGRFCGECRKVVRELAQLTEREARALLASPPTEGLCVRYVHDTTGEIVFRPDVPASALSRAKRVAALALAVALPLAATGCMGAPAQMMGAVRPVPPDPPAETMGAVTMGAPPVPVATDGGAPVTPVDPPSTAGGADAGGPFAPAPSGNR